MTTGGGEIGSAFLFKCMNGLDGLAAADGVLQLIHCGQCGTAALTDWHSANILAN